MFMHIDVTKQLLNVILLLAFHNSNICVSLKIPVSVGLYLQDRVIHCVFLHPNHITITILSLFSMSDDACCHGVTQGCPEPLS